MRPITLRFRAFGSYAGEAVVDFTKFRSGLYWVTGATGSGKTTIFDAMMFALYGEASGSARDAKMLHSDFVSKSVPTEVELVFEHGGSRYRVARTIKFTKKRGTADEYGDAKQGADLDERVGDPEGATVTGSDKVTKRIEAIVGLNADQFRKIVMLAQGEFQRFLKADTKERGDIMGKLFDASPYVAMQNRLKAAKGALDDRRREEVGRIAAAMNSFRRPAGLTAEEEARFGAYHPDLLESLTALVAADKEAVKSLAERKREADKKVTELTTERKLAADRNGQLDRLTEAVSGLAVLEAEADEYNELRREYALAEKAFRKVYPADERAKEKNDAYVNLLETIDNLSVAVGEAAAEEAEARKKAEADEPLKSKIEEHRGEVQRVSSLLPLYDDVAHAERAYQAADKKVTELENALLLGKKRIEELGGELTKITTELEGLEGIDGIAEKADGERKKAKERLDAFTGEGGLANTVELILLEEETLDKARELRKGLVGETLKLHDKYSALYKAFLEGQAGIMAGILAEDVMANGQACCPVCKTLVDASHLDALADKDENVPTEERVNEARALWEQSDARTRELGETVAAAEGKLESALAQALKNASELAGAPVSREMLLGEDFLDNCIKEAEKALNEAEKAHTEALKKQRRRTELILQQKELSESLKKAEESVAQDSASLGEAKASESAAKAVLLEKKALLPYPEKRKASEYIAAQRKAADELQKQVDEDALALDNAGKKKAAAEGALKNANDSLPGAAKAAKVAQKAYEKAVVDTGFADDEAYLEALSPVSEEGEEWLTVRRSEIEEYDKRLSAAKTLVETLTESTKDFVMADLAALDEKLNEAAEEAGAIGDRHSELLIAADNHAHTYESVKASYEKLAKTDKSAQRIGTLATLANGEVNSENGKLSFERYVMGSVFREVLERANMRLDVMTGGQFELRHTIQEMGARSNTQSGLGIELFDAITGLSRSTGSISGGETFMVSMALALGLSDVVQSRSGGISMEALFIDEGFGSLSSEVLDIALQVLEQLSSGNRLVGVISHVDKMAECITQKIKVYNEDRKGSRLEIEI